ncbi:hypothetical protein LDENG_00070180 [Lucifuga dentata]|nr:hypothetical protein LDENG_00070180 [Lucifuga dentata]
MNSEVFRNILFAQVQANTSKLIGQCFIKTTIPDMLLKQQRRFSELKDGRFLTGQVSHLI